MGELVHLILGGASALRCVDAVTAVQAAAQGLEVAGLQTWILQPVWEFPKILGTLFWGPNSKDPTI